VPYIEIEDFPPSGKCLYCPCRFLPVNKVGPERNKYRVVRFSRDSEAVAHVACYYDSIRTIDDEEGELF
jgi:hypothetical protein